MTSHPSTAAPGYAPHRHPAGASSAIIGLEQRRRLQPHLWDTDWLVLRGMRKAIDDLAGRIASPGKVALDFGCGAKPYAQLFTTRGVIYVGADLGTAHDVQIRADGTLSAAEGSADLVVSFVGPLAWTTMVRLTCFAVALRRLPLVGKSLAAAVAVIMNLKAGIEDWITPTWVTKDIACVYVTLSRRSPTKSP
jgi:hypothetical protein